MNTPVINDSAHYEPTLSVATPKGFLFSIRQYSPEKHVGHVHYRVDGNAAVIFECEYTGDIDDAGFVRTTIVDCVFNDFQNTQHRNPDVVYWNNDLAARFYHPTTDTPTPPVPLSTVLLRCDAVDGIYANTLNLMDENGDGVGFASYIYTDNDLAVVLAYEYTGNLTLDEAGRAIDQLIIDQSKKLDNLSLSAVVWSKTANIWDR